MFLSFVDTSTLSSFSELYLLKSNQSSLRWQAHQLLHCLYQYASAAEQVSLVEMLWSLWPTMPNYGHKASQFVDLLGFLTISTPEVLQKVRCALNGNNDLLEEVVLVACSMSAVIWQITIFEKLCTRNHFNIDVL